MLWNDFTERYTNGSRISPAVTLSTQNVHASASSITWNALTPEGTTLVIEIALSTDGGTTWSAWQQCMNGSAVPGISELSSLANVQLKIRETLTTTNVHATPELQDLTITITTAWDNIAYGPNKSTLTAWDSISLAWKPERLSLVVNDTEACYIENPGLPSALGSYLFIGTDRNGANAINTLVDELRVDKVYKDVATRTAWHKTGSPFYTSEEMKQWPGYIKIVTDGVEVYDSSGNLRVKLGSWLKDLLRKYGLKVHDGEIYSSIVRSGAEDADTYIQLMPPNKLQVYNAGKKQLEIDVTSGGRVQFFYNDATAGEIKGTSNTDILVWTMQKLYLNGQQGVEVYYDLKVNGDLTCTGAKPAQQVTDNYGLRYMYATEAPELVYYDRGQGQLVNGECTIYLDPIYLECIELDTKLTPWQIWVQCYGENDVCVSEVGANYFKIKERNGGTSNNKVVWKHEAIRKNYAGIRLMEVVD